MKPPEAAVDTITKAMLRSQALACRNALGDAARAAASDSIAERAGEILASVRPNSVSLYLPIGSECETGSLIARAASIGAEIGLPTIIDETRIVFRRYQPGDALVAGKFGTSAPLARAPLMRPEVIVMPLVAFDRNGTRLGYGRGHYDRAINTMREAGQRPKLLGIAFSVQEVGTIPVEPHDVGPDWIVTEKGSLAFKANGD